VTHAATRKTGARAALRSRRRSGATVRDVARAAGVSTATVSRALRLPGLVRPATRGRVERAIVRLDYVADGVARALSTRRTHTIGAVIPTLNNAIYAVSTHSLQKVLERAGYTLLLACHEFDLEAEARMARTFVEKGVDALVLVGTAHHPSTERLLAGLTVPHVLTWAVDRSGLHPSVGFDNRAAGRILADYLVELGHRRIAMISGMTAGNDRARDRLAGVRAALAGAGVKLAHVTESPYTLHGGREALARLLAKTRPTAVVCGNDVLAIGAIQEAQRLGLSVPDELSVAGFDDMEFATVIAPALTTVRFPIADIAAEAARHLLARIAGDSPSGCVELPLELVVRGSTGKPRRS
jgi:LacI family transcriptional regulator